MAVARMKRALIIGYEADARQLTRSLQRGGVIHVESTELVEGDGPPGAPRGARGGRERVLR